MRRLFLTYSFCAAIVGIALIGSVRSAPKPDRENQAAAETNPEPDVFFETRVRPILREHCYKCHGNSKSPKGSLRLTSRASLLKGGDLGPAVDLDQPAESLLLEAVRYEGLEMPPTGKLDQAKIDVLVEWVNKGVPWSPGADNSDEVQEEPSEPTANVIADANFWSFQPIVRPQVPAPSDSAWVQNPVDAFILSQLEHAGLKPAAPASRIALLRRLYYDLTGLPPTPAQVDAYLADTAPDAYERLVDHLLASPAYGERWGRHWLDVVRFAETNSFERDELKPNAWRYRDYVIRSLNADKPYDQFVREQLAGDELPQATAETIVATGYYRLGPWDIEPTDVLQAQFDELDDIVSTTGQALLGLTINCARCHDHKLDPISQADYYSTLAFFRGVLPTETVHMRDATRIGNTQVDITDTENPDESRRQLEAWQEKLAEMAHQIAKSETAIAKRQKPPGDQDSSVGVSDATGSQQGRASIEAHAKSVLSVAEFGEFMQLKRTFQRMKELPPAPLHQALAVKETGTNPPETHVLIRGNAHAEGQEVQPAFLSVLHWSEPVKVVPPNGNASSGRRLAFADWVTDQRNPLVARVMVNRIWQHHFHRGIVRSPNDFGTHGEPPTHPQLLDWLAAELSKQGWRLKPLHRLMLTSNAYRMSSHVDPHAIEQDPSNNLFWRMDMRRLGAEEVRDSILAVTGTLNPGMEGESVCPEIPSEVLHGQSRPGNGWELSPPGEQVRRSVYVHVKRSLVLPVLASFDVADNDFSCPVRFATTQPTQALGMLNSDFLNEQASRFANRLRHEEPENPTGRIQLALRLATSREAGPSDIERGVRLLETLETEHGLTEDQALVQFCLMVLNLNEFIYLD